MNTLRNRAAFWGAGRGSGEGQGRKLKHLGPATPNRDPQNPARTGCSCGLQPGQGRGQRQGCGPAGEGAAPAPPGAPDRPRLLPRPLPRPSPRGWWAPARYASGQVWSRRRPVVSRPSPSLGNLEAPSREKTNRPRGSGHLGRRRHGPGHNAGAGPRREPAGWAGEVENP